MFGNGLPYPYRCIPASKHPLVVLERDFIQSLGSGLANGKNPILRAKYHAIARFLWELFENNVRLANQFNPETMTDFLSRWENIYGLTYNSFLSDSERRQAVADKLLQYNSIANNYGLYLLATTVLGDAFVDIEFTTPDFAAAQGTATVPGGIAGTYGGTVYQDDDWRSAVSFIRVVVTRGNMPAGDYAFRLHRFKLIVQNFMPAWTMVHVNQSGGFVLGVSQLGLDGFEICTH